jgi:diguanylate cyclase (GGDEF)-like protein
VSVLGAAALPVFFLADNSPDQLALARVRFMMIAIPSGTITACWLQRLWTGARRPWPLGTRYLFAAAMFAAIMHLGRVVAVWSMHGPLDPLLTPVAPVAVLGMLPTSVLMAFGLILQVEARARNRLIVANVQLAHDVETDALTGLGNRRRLENAAVRELSRARRYSWPVTVMLLDLDHFKNINDQWGHHAGDAVLCEVAARCLRILRSHDVLVRWGGEEFAVLLPQCDLATSEGIAERILEAMREQPLEAIHGERLTVSIGLAAVEPAEPTIEAALKRADAALYRAKHAGRNRHAVAGTESVWEDSETNLSSLSPARRRSAS